MRKVLKIDCNGYFVEDVLLEDGETTPTDCVETECPEGFYKPKWDGTQWVEGLAPDEIASLTNVQNDKTDSEKIKERLDATEDAITVLMDLFSMQGR